MSWPTHLPALDVGGAFVTAPTTPTFDYDVALSYAGEDHAYVDQVAALLRDHGVKLFYADYATAELWGSDLYTLLDEVYRKRARFTVAFISRHYVAKPWTQHERRSAQARSLGETRPYLLPVRFDDSELPGLPPTVHYLDAHSFTPAQLVTLIEQKLSQTPGITTPDRRPLRMPRTPEQQRELLAQRPPAWEYLLYAGVIWQRRQALEAKWRDYELGLAPRTGQHLDDAAASRFMGHVMNDLATAGSTIMKLLDPKVQELAFGPLGTPGDPARIEHIATRFVDMYEQIMDMAAVIRGTGVSTAMAPVMEAGARLTADPLRQIRDFIDQLVAETDSLPERLAAADGPLHITLMLKLSIDEEANRQLDREIAHALQQIGIR